jgi:hypothetical protein
MGAGVSRLRSLLFVQARFTRRAGGTVRLRRKVGQPILAAAGFPAGWSGPRVQGGAGSKAGCRQDCLPHNSSRQQRNEDLVV